MSTRSRRSKFFQEFFSLFFRAILWFLLCFKKPLQKAMIVLHAYFKVYGRTTITNVHPKRPWMCFSDKYYRRKVDSLLSRSLRDPAVPGSMVTFLENRHRNRRVLMKLHILQVVHMNVLKCVAHLCTYTYIHECKYVCTVLYHYLYLYPVRTVFIG